MVGEDAGDEGGTSTRGTEDGEGEGELVSSDEEDVERQEQFERQYNFRFEEPGGAAVSELHGCYAPATPQPHLAVESKTSADTVIGKLSTHLVSMLTCLYYVIDPTEAVYMMRVERQ